MSQNYYRACSNCQQYYKNCGLLKLASGDTKRMQNCCPDFRAINEKKR